LLRWWAKYKVNVIVNADGITVAYLASSKIAHIPFASLKSYRHESFNGRLVLHFKLTDGTKLKMVANDLFGRTGDFTGCIQAVEMAVEHYQEANFLLITREKSFFEKPIATAMLAVCWVLVLLMLWDMVARHKPLTGVLITELGVLISASAVWYAARRR
jgi:hypothetical protein